MNNRQLSFKGTHKEIGVQVGEQYKAWGNSGVYIPKFADDYFQIQKKIYDQYFHEYIDYLEGVAEGLKTTKDEVLKSFLTGFLPFANTTPPHKCSVFAVNDNSKVFIGRNYDWIESSELASKSVAFEFTDNSSHNIIGITDMGTWKRNTSVNSDEFVIMLDDAWNDSLYVGLNGAPGNKNSTGMLSSHIVQLVAEKCKTTKEAIDLIQKIPTNQSIMFTIADKESNFAVVENSLENGVYIRGSSDFIATTNHFVHPNLGFENLGIFKDVPFHSTFARYEYIKLSVDDMKEKVSIDSIINMMTKPPVLQNWRGVENGDTMTIWTLGLNLATSEYKISFAPNLDNHTYVQNS